MTQIEENAVFFQIEFGIKAGLPFFSCRVIQKMNTGTRMIDRTSKKIFAGDFRLCGLALTVLIYRESDILHPYEGTDNSRKDIG